MPLTLAARRDAGCEAQQKTPTTATILVQNPHRLSGRLANQPEPVCQYTPHVPAGITGCPVARPQAASNIHFLALSATAARLHHSLTSLESARVIRLATFAAKL